MPGAFLIMPFSPETAGGEDARVLGKIRKAVEDACRAQGVNLFRADDIFASGVVIDQVRQALEETDLVFAVCTGRNANVFYELGMADVLGHKPILIARASADLPFDVAHYRAQLYGKPQGVDTLRGRLEKAIQETLIEGIGRVVLLRSSQPGLGLAAIATGSSTTTAEQNKRIVSAVNIVLFLRNEETAGEARNCKVELLKTAAPGFKLGRNATDASENLINGDTWRILWQPGTLAPGAERELPLKSDSFAFEGESASGLLRLTAQGMKSLTATLEVRVGRYDDDTGAAEFEVAVTPEPDDTK